MKKNILVFFLFCCLFESKAQEMTGRSVSDNFMRSSGRIYVVIAVILLILLGIFYYLLRIDRKLRRVEKEVHDN